MNHQKPDHLINIDIQFQHHQSREVMIPFAYDLTKNTHHNIAKILKKVIKDSKSNANDYELFFTSIGKSLSEIPSRLQGFYLLKE